MTKTWLTRLTDSRTLSISLLIGIGLLYWPTVSHAFVWDDLTFVKALWPLREPVSWWTAVQQPFPITPGYFRPLGVLALTVQFGLAGRDPALFHLTSLILHLLNTVLVGWLARLAWPERRRASVFALAIYGLHPALLEGVAFASSQFDLWVTLGLLLALVVEGQVKPPLIRAAVIGGLFVTAALFKEMAVVLVVVLPLWQLSRDGSWAAWRSHLRERAPTYAALLLAGVIYLGLRVSALSSLLPSSSSQIPTGDVLQHLLLIARSLVEYLLVIVWPFGTLTPIHYSTLPILTTDGLAWLSFLVALVVIAGLVMWVRRAPRSGWLAAAALLSLLPVLNIVPLNLAGGAFVAERFLVFPLALLAAAISGPLLAAVQRARRQVGVVTIGLWIIAAIITLVLVGSKWTDGLSLWTWASERAPQSSIAWSGLANEYNDRGDYQAGLAAAQRATQLDASNEWGWNNAGQALFGLGRYDEARAQFEQAIQLTPGNALFWNNLGGVFLQQGLWSQAEQNLLKARDIEANNALVNLNLGALYFNLDRPDLALGYLQAAGPLLPPEEQAKAQTLIERANQPDAWLRLIDQQLGRQDSAAAWQALAGAEQRGAAASDLAIGHCTILIAQGYLTDAESACLAASTRSPNDARPYNNLGIIARQRGDIAAARQFFQRAIDLQPDWALPRQNLAQLPGP